MERKQKLYGRRLIIRIRNLILEEKCAADVKLIAQLLRERFPEYRHCQSFSNDVIEALTEVLEKNLNLNDEIVDVHEESAKSNENRKRKLNAVGSFANPVVLKNDEISLGKHGEYKTKTPDLPNRFLRDMYKNHGQRIHTDRINGLPKVKPKMHASFPTSSVESSTFEPKRSFVTFDDIGGCESQFMEVCQLLIHLKRPQIYETLGVSPPVGLLIHGPPGCGKTLFGRAVAGEFDLPLIEVTSTELIGGVSGESEDKIRTLFSKAYDASPCILMIDEIDAITPRREYTSREMERRIVSQLLACLDFLSQSNTSEVEAKNVERESRSVIKQVLVIGITSRLDSIDPALRRAKRFDKEVALGIPDEEARKSILEIVSRNLRLGKDVNFERIARLTPGYVGADLNALAREASLSAIYRIFGETISSSPGLKYLSLQERKEELRNRTVWLKSKDSFDYIDISNLQVTNYDFENALTSVQPSALREGFSMVTDVKWDDIGALCDVRNELQWSILHPIKHPEDFNLLAIESKPQGILLCGPPGCGKTLLAKAVANETGMNFISIKGPELLCMYVGESERAVRTVFQRARDSSPCVIFFDEIDALCPKRSKIETSGSARLVNQLLTEMDGMSNRKQIFIIGATNRPDIVDPAVLRPGRLDKVIFVDFPTSDDRVDILLKQTKNGTRPRIADDVSLVEIAKNPLMEWFTGADIAALIHEASIIALQERMLNKKTDALTMKHFLIAMKSIRPSVSESDREHYKKIKARYGKRVSKQE